MVNDEIIVFAGHYTHDPGCVVDGVTEHTYTTIVADKTVKQAYDEGLPVLRGINSQLWHKIDWINTNHPASNGVIEIHFNCATNPKAQGTEVLYHAGSYHGKLLAACIYRQLIQALWNHRSPKIKCRGMKTDETIHWHLGFLSHTIPPAVITESLFLSNESEREMLLTEEVQNKIANAHIEGIKDYMVLKSGNIKYY